MNRRVVFISGATSGIGAAFAKHFAQRGYDLIITGRPDEEISPCIKELKEKNNIDVELILAEFANENDVAKIAGIIKDNGKIEILINNAGYGIDKLFWQDDIRNQENMVKVHINASLRFIHAALPNMIREKKGTIINLSSLASFLPIPKDAMYSASKIFNNSFMESLHISLRDKGIKIQVLCPGFVCTNFHARPDREKTEFKNRGIIRWMQPDKVVEISVRNLVKKNKVIVIPGFWNRIVRLIYIILPTRVYYNLATKYLQ
jgi:Short-chain dehydrogenases of various substrate specificities